MMFFIFGVTLANLKAAANVEHEENATIYLAFAQCASILRAGLK